MTKFQKQWGAYRAIYPKVIAANQEEVMRRSFYAGALSGIEEVLKLTKLPKENADEKIAALASEVLKTLNEHMPKPV